MGEARRGMETQMVCSDYRHAGMMSCQGCVQACNSAQIRYNISITLLTCVKETLYIILCACPRVRVNRVCLHSVQYVCGWCL